MTDEHSPVTDPALAALLDAVDQYAFGTVVTAEMHRLILKSYQAGRNRVAIDLAESDRKKEISQEFAAIKVKLDMLERAYVRQMAAPPEFLSPEQVIGIIERVRDALVKQAKKND